MKRSANPFLPLLRLVSIDDRSTDVNVVVRVDYAVAKCESDPDWRGTQSQSREQAEVDRKNLHRPCSRSPKQNGIAEHNTINHGQGLGNSRTEPNNVFSRSHLRSQFQALLVDSFQRMCRDQITESQHVTHRD